MKKLILIAALVATAGLTGCVTPVGPVEVTRFHAADTRALGRGSISIEPAPGIAGQSLEFRSYAVAVARELIRLGYVEAPAGSGGHIAVVRLTRESIQPQRTRGPVSVGVGGSTGSYGGGVGLGIGIDLSGLPPEQVATELAVTIRERSGGPSGALALWEGRASFSVRASSPLAGTQLGAAKLAEALFKDFPGQSGETTLVK